MKNLITVWSLGITAMVVILVAQKPNVQHAFKALAAPVALGVGTGALVAYGFKSGALN